MECFSWCYVSSFAMSVEIICHSKIIKVVCIFSEIMSASPRL